MFYIMHNIGKTKVSVLDTDDMVAEVVTRSFLEENKVNALSIKDVTTIREFYSEDFNFVITNKFIYISNESVAWRLKLSKSYNMYRMYTWRGFTPETLMTYFKDLDNIIIYKESDNVVMQFKFDLICFVFDTSGVIRYYENYNKDLSLTNNSTFKILKAHSNIWYQEDFKEYIRKDQSVEKRKELLG